MKTKIFIITLLLASGIFFSQCKKDLLNKSPQDSANVDNFFTDATSARQALVAIFPYMQSYWVYGNCYMPTYLDMLSDDAWLYGNRKNNAWRSAWTDWNITPDFTSTGSPLLYEWWANLYYTINAASFAVDYIPTSSNASFTAELQKPYIGVAKMLRALAYIYLSTLWGDVPLHKNYITDIASAYVAKSSKSDVLQFAIEDLIYATANVPDAWTGSDIGLPTKAAAAGFLARAYLYAKDYPNAVTAAKNALDIADACGFGLMDDYVTMMSEASQPNKEFIFAYQFLPNLGTAPISNQGIVYRGVRDDPAFIQNLTYGAGFGYAVPTRNLVDAFEAGDPRRKASMWIAGDYFGIYSGPDTSWTNPYDTVTTAYHEGDTIKYLNGWSFGNVNTRKIQTSVIGLANEEMSGYDIPILRYAELYLYYAEALIENGQISEGMTQLNKVRARPSVNMPALTATDQADARAKLRHERRVELNMEGIRIFDLFRWGIMEDVFGTGTESRKILGQVGNDTLYRHTYCKFPRNNLLPIPQEEIDVNTNMTQNTDY
jgi:starch-binding outer membrane protein, SusD/RagB family